MGWNDSTIGWTEERAETCKKLWLEGLSASQIAKQLGGVTRNAVIGKVHRLGLSGRATPSQPRPVAYRAPRASRAASVSPVSRRVSEPGSNVQALDTTKKPAHQPVYREEGPGTATIHTLESHMCKWPIGDPMSDGFTFCGKKVAGRTSYCVDHARMAYQPQQAGKKKTSASELARSLRRYI